MKPSCTAGMGKVGTNGPRPPLGLRPESIAEDAHKFGRIREIVAALVRYHEAMATPPIEWLTELQRRTDELGA